MSHAHILTHTAGTGAGASGMPWFEAASRSRKPAGIPSSSEGGHNTTKTVFKHG